MTEEEAAKWREERNARGVARKQERDAGRAKMEKVGGARVLLFAALLCLHLGPVVDLSTWAFCPAVCH
jgi:hypothetical protein